MNNNHPLWEQFVYALDQVCFSVKDSEVISNCRGDYRFTEKILNSMPGVDFHQSLNFFQEHGGFCDCEILFNVVGSKES